MITVDFSVTHLHHNAYVQSCTSHEGKNYFIVVGPNVPRLYHSVLHFLHFISSPTITYSTHVSLVCEHDAVVTFVCMHGCTYVFFDLFYLFSIILYIFANTGRTTRLFL